MREFDEAPNGEACKTREWRGVVLRSGVQHITTSMSQVVPRRHNEFWGLIGTVLGHDLDTMEDSARLPAFGLLMK